MGSNNSNSSSGLMLIIGAIILFLAIGSCSKADPNDGKCDICGKAATYSSSSEEYCSKHLKDAVAWYAKQD